MKELKGVSGWLWWFVYVVLGLVGVLVNLISLGAYFVSSPSLGASAILALITLPVAGLAAAAFTLLVMEHTAGVTVAKVYLSVNMVLGFVAAVTTPSDARGPKLVILSGVWLVYLWTSKRVRNTYFAKGSAK
jgi:hypothetical protein